MSKLHTPLIDDFVNELLGDDSELQNAANQDDHSSTKDQAVQTPAPAATQEQATVEKPDTSEAETAQASTPVTTEGRTHEDKPSPTPEPTEQTTIHAEPEVQAVEEISIEDNPAIEDHPDQTPTPAEIEANTVVEELACTTLDDYAAATAIIENFKANVGNAATKNERAENNPASTEDRTEQTPTSDDFAVQAAEEQPSNDHPGVNSPDPEAIAASALEDFENEFPEQAVPEETSTINTATTHEPSDQTSTRAESEMQTAEELSVKNHRPETAPDSTITATTHEPSDQTSTQSESEMQPVEELSVENHPASTEDRTDQTPTHVGTEVEAVEELSMEDNSQAIPPDSTDAESTENQTNQTSTQDQSEMQAVEDHPASTEDRTDQTPASDDFAVQAAEEQPSIEHPKVNSPDPEAIAASVIEDFDAEFPDQAEQEVADTVPEENAAQPDPDAIAASVIEDFEAEFPDQAEQEVTDTVPEENAAQPDPDAIAASVIEDFEAEFPDQAEQEVTDTVPEENAAQPDPDAIAASVIEDFEAEFPDQGTQSSAPEPASEPDPEAIAASVIADFDAEFPEAEPAKVEAAAEASTDQVTEPSPQVVPEIAAAPQTEAHAEVTHDFPLDLQQWLQPPPLDENEIEIVTYMRCVSFELQGQHYAAEVQTLLEVLDHADIVPIPSMRHPVLGILNLRGSIVPVIDPSTLLGLPPCTDTDTQLLVAEYDNAAVALPVSDVSEVVNIDQNDIQKAPQSAKHVMGLAPLGDEMLTLLDLKALINAILNP